MAKVTVAMLQAENEALRSQAFGLEEQLRQLQSRIKHDYIERSEYNRVQALLRSTQQFCKKYKTEARPNKARQRQVDQRVGDETAAQRTIREHRERRHA